MAGHWYNKNGDRCDYVKGARGQDVKPDIRHAKKLGLAPGVTSIIKMAASEGITQYRERQVLTAALETERTEGESNEAFCARVMRISKEHAEQAAENGSLIHAKIERGIHDTDTTDEHVVAAGSLLWPLQKQWLTEHAAVSDYGFATKADLFTPPDECSSGYLIDVKTKNGDVSELGVYDEHAMQLAATLQALGHDTSNVKCAILFLSRNVEASAKLVYLDTDDIKRGWAMFFHLLCYWRIKNNYTPPWAMP